MTEVDVENVAVCVMMMRVVWAWVGVVECKETGVVVGG